MINITLYESSTIISAKILNTNNVPAPEGISILKLIFNNLLNKKREVIETKIE